MNTLVGKNNWLFLLDGSAGELTPHCQGITSCVKENFNKYLPYLDKLLVVVYPDKSVVCGKYLPEGYEVKYRPSFDLGKAAIPNNLLDGLEFIQHLTPEEAFYKTDTHPKQRAVYLIYRGVVERLNRQFGTQLVPKECSFTSRWIERGMGDLTTERNRGSLVLPDIPEEIDVSDDIVTFYDFYDRDHGNHYKIEPNDLYQLRIYNLYGQDAHEQNLGTLMNWPLMGAMAAVMHSPHPTNSLTVLIFYDSFSVNAMSLFIELFHTTIWLKKPLSSLYIERYPSDLILELRVERLFGILQQY